MGLIFLVVFLCFSINCFFFIYDEAILLSIYFLIFFLIMYISLKSKFKIFNILKILRKYVLFIILFRVNLNYNKLLSFYTVKGKRLFIRFLLKLKLYKHIIRFILSSLLNKYKELINILFLSFIDGLDNIKEKLVLYIFFLIKKINFYDN